MMTSTKGDLVRAALRKIGVASDATLTDVEPQSMEDAISDLEMMMSEWYQDGNGIITGYIFSTDTPPSDGDIHGMRTSSISAVVHNLAVRISPDYAVDPPQKVVATAKYGKERLYQKTAISRAKKGPYPSRMPIGSGNKFARLNNWNFYPGRNDADSTATPDEGNG